MKQLAYLLFTAIFVYFACRGCGQILFRLLHIRLFRAEERYLVSFWDRVA